ncbi:cation transporter [Azospirillum soli]|uniref:cation transporter n=1 Tax=Azospirillum soli TaxID=1304799 RepID=UPI001AE26CEE|nr:cation transporter [Azospirillum soli]MBP2316309.1 Co/Zn/Cd efflux system component [Azospirillum soli]
MGSSCCASSCSSSKPPVDRTYRRILWIALAVNATMFLVELVAGAAAGSVSLQADAMDFLADSANYLISLLVLGMALTWRARAALLKGLSLGVIGLWVAGQTLWNAIHQTVPEAHVMGVVGTLALLANVGVAVLLYAHRHGDSNRQSVWICSRNDAIANLAVLAAAAGVFGTGTGWPDVVVAAVMAGLSVSGAAQIVRQALAELRPGPAGVAAE